MNSRKMWAPKGWEALPANEGVWTTATDHFGNQVPVLVTDATDMPDFEVGDGVSDDDGREWVVDGLYVDAEGDWTVACVRNGWSEVKLLDPRLLTKLPRETSVLLRVTGPEDVVGYVADLYEGKKATMCLPEGVRVERVEEGE